MGSAMGVKKIVQYGDPRLRLKSAEVGTNNEAFLKTVWTDLEDTLLAVMEHHQFSNAAGLSAIQIGKKLRMCVVVLPDRSWRFMANPLLIHSSEEAVCTYEGCLSYWERRGFLCRPRRIVVSYINETLKETEEAFEDWGARIVMHEMDHMDGILYIDRIADKSKIIGLEDYQRIKARSGASKKKEEKGEKKGPGSINSETE